MFRVFMKMSRIIIVIIFVSVFFLICIYNTSMHEANDTLLGIPNLGHSKLHFILQWTNRSKAPFNFMGRGNSSFVRNKCRYQNCFVTDNRTYFDSPTDFDAIAFNGRDVSKLLPYELPPTRSPKQKYIFGAMESADNFPVCDQSFDGYFNWTWTYKLDSDFRWGYITIYDLDGNVVGPVIDMKWPDEMEPIDERLKVKLSKKNKAAASFISHCSTRSKREAFVDELKTELHLYQWAVDIYGKCGPFVCPKKDYRRCFKMLENEYYFYLSFENSYAEDYVTEKLLNALNYYVVPVVYGGANYSRFLPPGSYLDARKLGPKQLARRINEIIRDKNTYYDFFRWRNHYTYRETSSKEDICKLCEMMNDINKRQQSTVWNDFRTWWNGARYKYNC